MSVEELEYAFVDFYETTNILPIIREVGNRFHYSHLSLNNIAKMRRDVHWLEYIETLEYIINRSKSYQIDFTKIELLITELSKSMSSALGNIDDNSFVPAYTFRVCIGNYVIDAVTTEFDRKLLLYPGGFYGDGQNHLTIYFLVGDTTDMNTEMLYPQYVIFDGVTNLISGESYKDELCGIFKRLNFKEVG